MKTAISIIFLLLLSNPVQSQKKPSSSSGIKSKPAKEGKFGILPGIGYLWNGHSNLDLALKPFYLTGRGHDNFNISLGVDIFKHNVTYATKFAGIGYFREKESGFSAYRFAVYYATTTMQGITDQRLVAEIGTGSFPVSIVLGYSVPLGHDQLSWMRDWHVAIRIPGY